VKEIERSGVETSEDMRLAARSPPTGVKATKRTTPSAMTKRTPMAAIAALNVHFRRRTMNVIVI